MLVGLDSNVIDLIEEACCSSQHVDAMEAMEPPPRFRDMHANQEAEVFACYWLLAMAPAWRSTLYTFSDALYEELSQAERAEPLLRVAVDVLLRERQDPAYRQPDPRKRPAPSEIVCQGIGAKDAVHVADAIGLSCDYFLTNDRQLRNRTSLLEAHWHLRVRRPSEFLVEAVRDRAPWTTLAPWPWESIRRIGSGVAHGAAETAPERSRR